MFEIGWTEMLVIAVVMIVVVGPKDLPKMLRTFGRTTAKLRAMAGDFQRQFNEALKEAELDDVKESVDSLRKLNPANEIRKQFNPFEKAAADVRSGLSTLNQPKQASPAPAVTPAPAPADAPKAAEAGAAVPPVAMAAAPAAAAFPEMSDPAPAKAPKPARPRAAKATPAAASPAAKPAAKPASAARARSAASPKPAAAPKAAAAPTPRKAPARKAGSDQ